MATGASIKFTSYNESVSKILEILRLERGLASANIIVLKPFILDNERYTPVEFVEPILKFCLLYKNPSSKVFIAEGIDGHNTMDLFDSLGYRRLAEKYSIGLIDLNNTELENIEKAEFEKFPSIAYPSILKDSFIISLAKLYEDDELGITGSLASMLGAFPASHYKGLLSKKKSKIRKWPIKYAVHDIVECKSPDFAVIDASEQGLILAGLPMDTDKQAAKLMGKDWSLVPYINLLEEHGSEYELRPPIENEI